MIIRYRSATMFLLSAVASIATPITSSAHHSFAVFYDSSKMVTVSGIVTRYDYRMPHIEIDVEERQSNDAGESITKTWKIETLNSRLAATYFLLQDSLQVGDPVEIKGWPAKDGSDTLGGHQIILPDGEVFVLRRSPRESPVRFRSIHGYTGERKSPSPKELASGVAPELPKSDDAAMPPADLSASDVSQTHDQPHDPGNQSTIEDPQLEFIEQMEEASFAVASLKDLLEQRRSVEGQLAEIENLQVAMFNAKVLIPLIELSDGAKKHFRGDEKKARSEMAVSIIQSLRSTLAIEEHVIAGRPTEALQSLESMRQHQHATHLIFQ